MLEDERVPKEVALKAQRLEGAHLVRLLRAQLSIELVSHMCLWQNGNEVLPLWVAAVVSLPPCGVID